MQVRDGLAGELGDGRAIARADVRLGECTQLAEQRGVRLRDVR